MWSWLDTILKGTVVVVATIVGINYQRIADLERAVTERGGVKISMEADQRLTKLETQLDTLTNDIVRRLDRMEKQIDSLPRN